MPCTQVIKLALLGGPGVGKDTFVQIFRKKYPFFSCQTLRLAEPLYEVQDFIYQICSKKIEKGMQDGVLLNFLGKHMRHIYPDVLLDRLAKSVEKSELTADLIFCSDVRPIDVPFIKQIGFTIVNIATDPHIAIERRRKRGDLSLGNMHHETELGIQSDMYDYQINNNHSMSAFEQAVLLFFEEFLK